MKTINLPILTALLLSSALSLTPASSHAAEKTNDTTHAERFRERLQEISQALNLTEDQKAKLKPLLQAEMVKIKALRADTSLTHAQKAEQFKAIRQDSAPQVKAILTPEQLEKWQQIRAEFRAKRGQAANSNS